MKADLRISVNDFYRDNNLEILLFRAEFTHRQFVVRMNGAPWAMDDRLVSVTQLTTALPKTPRAGDVSLGSLIRSRWPDR